MSRTEALFLTGLALVTGGLAAIYWPMALIFAGAALSIIAFKLEIK